jgi:hypothetical protein
MRAPKTNFLSLITNAQMDTRTLIQDSLGSLMLDFRVMIPIGLLGFGCSAPHVDVSLPDSSCVPLGANTTLYGAWQAESIQSNIHYWHTIAECQLVIYEDRCLGPPGSWTPLVAELLVRHKPRHGFNVRLLYVNEANPIPLKGEHVVFVLKDDKNQLMIRAFDAVGEHIGDVPQRYLTHEQINLLRDPELWESGQLSPAQQATIVAIWAMSMWVDDGEWHLAPDTQPVHGAADSLHFGLGEIISFDYAVEGRRLDLSFASQCGSAYIRLRMVRISDEPGSPRFPEISGFGLRSQGEQRP